MKYKTLQRVNACMTDWQTTSYIHIVMVINERVSNYHSLLRDAFVTLAHIPVDVATV